MIKFKVKSSVLHNGLVVYASKGEFNENDSVNCAITRDQLLNNFEGTLEICLNALANKLYLEVADEEPKADATALG